MPSVHLESVAFAHADADPIFDDLCLVLPAGWTGLVGDNGCGKSTLLGLLCGALSPAAGRVRLDPPGARVLLCTQTAEALDPAIGDLAERWDRRAIRTRARLGLEPEALARWPTLSPGERRRWQVGAALVLEPDVLLLDEPTDHLDADARDQLVAALVRFRGVGVVVSHDRTLLDGLTQRTVRIRAGGVDEIRGSYAVARKEWQATHRRREREHERRRSEEKRTRRRLQAQRERLDRANANLSTRKRMRNAGDNEARGMLAKNQARAGASHAAHGVRLLGRELARAEQRSQATRTSKERGRSLFVAFEPARQPLLMAVRAPALWAGRGDATAGPPLLRDLDLCVRRDDRLWLRGPNGAGKTTLLRALLRGARLPAERLLHLPQELAPGAVAQLQRDAAAADEETRGRIGALLAALGADPERVLASARPSPGEARKLALAFGLGRQVVGAVLDEPTNHLDLASVERLEAALESYPGALVLVSHDDALGRRLSRTTWELEGGRVRVGSLPGPDEAAPGAAGTSGEGPAVGRGEGRDGGQ